MSVPAGTEMAQAPTMGAIKRGCPACVRLQHLYTGTQLDNMHDRRDRGRANVPRGENHWQTRRRRAGAA